MKKTMKLASLILAMIMVISFVLPVHAANETYEIVINKEETGRQYQAYQIFVGTLDKDENNKLVLSTIEWGTGVTEDGKTAIGNAQARADKIITAQNAEDFAKEVAPYLSDTAAIFKYNETNKNYVASNLLPGYYLIKEADNSLPAEKGYTAFILKVVGDTEATPKDGETTVIKKVDDKVDSNTTEDEIIWQDSADHDIGDAIDFKLEATITDNYAEYDTYYLALHDTEEKGLTFNKDSVKVYVDDVQITSGYEIVTDAQDGCTFEVVFANLKNVSAVKAKSVIRVEYQSVLNADAVIGNVGNVNKLYGEFSNNPNNEQRGKTKEDTVIVFTYEVVVNKVNEKDEPLSGATFTLEKFVADENGTETYKNVKGKWVAISTVETQPKDEFTFRGLDDGEYRLTETEAPALYNKIDPILFTVKADHEVVWGAQDRKDVLTSFSGDVASGEITFTADKASGDIKTKVVNERGLILPETGGIGTTIFYIVGGLLVVGVVVFLITRKRMNSNR